MQPVPISIQRHLDEILIIIYIIARRSIPLRQLPRPLPRLPLHPNPLRIRPKIPMSRQRMPDLM
jgi:hypothetical protein